MVSNLRMLLEFLVFVVIVGSRGNATVDNELPLPATTKLLQGDNIKPADYKSCNRPCKFNVKPKHCTYKFTVEPIVREGRVKLAINEQVPGPPIHVCVNDIVVVEVVNKIPDQDLAIHWNGISQAGTPFMDGVPMITQCPISFGSKYKYVFRASVAGTFFYHAHSVSHQADGIYGSLIVNQPAPLEIHSTHYDYDRGMENTLLLAAEYPVLFTGNLKDLTNIHPDTLVINGRTNDFKMFVTEGYGYRIRLVNAVPTECPLAVAVEHHQLLVIAADASPVKPVLVKQVLLYPGERVDAVLRADQPLGGYWLRVRGRDACRGLETRAMVVYSGYNYTAMQQLDVDQNLQESGEVGGHGSHEGVLLSGQMLKAVAELGRHHVDRRFYLAIDRNTVSFHDSDNDFRYISDAIPKKPFYPSALSLHNGESIQINGKNFLYPNAPLLIQPNEVKSNIKCKLGSELLHEEVQCLLKYDALRGSTVELVLVNEGVRSNDSYTFHMHGLKLNVVATTSRGTKPISRDDAQSWDEEGKIHRNLLDPPAKDSIVVPNKGFVIVRINVDSKGSWLLECRSCELSALPVALLVHVPDRLPQPVVDALPSCGSYRPPDVLLH